MLVVFVVVVVVFAVVDVVVLEEDVSERNVRSVLLLFEKFKLSVGFDKTSAKAS